MKRKNIAKILTFTLTMSMLAAGGSYAWAEELQVMPVSEPVTIADRLPSYTSTQGVISETAADYIVTGETREDQKRFNISEQTVILQADGTPASLADCKEGTAVTVYHSMAATFSIPPQSAAQVIVLAGENPANVPLYGVVESVTETEKGVEILTEDGLYLFYGTADTQVVPYKTKNIVTLSDIQAGSRILAWADVVTLSLPGQAHPDMIMLLPGETPEASAAGITVNGELLENAAIEAIDGVLMVPVRAVGEKLGYAVAWNGAERSVSLSKDEQSVTVALGSKELSVARAAANMEQAPTLIGELTYVPATFFNTLLGAEDAVNIISADSIAINR